MCLLGEATSTVEAGDESSAAPMSPAASGSPVFDRVTSVGDARTVAAAVVALLTVGLSSLSFRPPVNAVIPRAVPKESPRAVFDD